MYIAPGQGQTTTWGQTFDVNRKPLSLGPFVAGLKNIALKSDFIYIVFMFRGRQSIGDKILMTTSLFPYVASFKMISSKSHFIHILMILYMYIAPEQGQKIPWGQTFNRKPLSLRPFVASFKQISSNFDFIHIFKCFFPTCI